MKVFIFTEGGENIGFGHITRCLALAEAFEEKGVIPEFFVHGDKSAEFLLKGKKYRIIDWIKRQQYVLNLINSQDLTIVDSYISDSSFYENLSRKRSGSLYIDDNARIPYPCGYVVNGNIYGEKLKYKRKQNSRYLLGPRYAILRKSFWGAMKYRIRKKINNILITFGGADPKNLTPKVLESIIDNYPDIHKRILIGPGFKNIKQIQRVADKKTHCIYNPDVKKIKKIMMLSDICISAGGQTLYELARIGIPTIAVAVGENQFNNVKEWERTGIIKYAGKWKDKSIVSKILQGFESYIPYEKRVVCQDKGAGVIDGKGAKRICKFILDRLEIKMRKCRDADCYDLWKWRNHPDIRRMCFNSKKITYKEHKRWFKKSKEDKNATIYIAENTGGEKLGQVRFNLSQNKDGLAYININLNPIFIGRGLGCEIIKLATQQFIKSNKKVKDVFAEILSTNEASKRSFKKARFVFSRHDYVKNEKICIFKYRGSYERFPKK